LINTEKKTEKCILVGVVLPTESRWLVQDHLDELASLAETAGAEVSDILIQEKKRFDPAYFIGRGKAEELTLKIEMESIDLLIFDDELTPAQVRNLERLTEVKVIDRAGLILDIFAAHARSKEARTQVELAQLNYLLPRLTRQWSHLSRQVGGIGTKGPGETQLETDRRLVRTRISFLKNELKNIEKHKTNQRKQQKEIHRISLVGYTNAGKSTLMNALTQADLLVENKLFATLDTTTRRMNINKSVAILISDTVGFIRKLPHHLIASFRSTLAQTIEADILIHVVDLSHPSYEEHIQVVNKILEDLGIADTPVLLAFNKVDKISEGEIFAQLQQKYPNAVFISAKNHIRLERFQKKITEMIHDGYVVKELDLSYDKIHLISGIRNLGEVLEQKYSEKNVLLQIRVKKENENKLERLLNA
jgi:GTP-binding protein HflX